jgi:hypothetical protein
MVALGQDKNVALLATQQAQALVVQLGILHLSLLETLSLLLFGDYLLVWLFWFIVFGFILVLTLLQC